MNNPELERIKVLARRLEVGIPAEISMECWMLPILEAMADKITRLEKGIKTPK